MEKLTIVKIGGAVLEDQEAMNEFLNNFVAIEGKKILVHGGGRKATKIMERLGIPAKMVEGRRITDAETLDVVTMVYGGLVNKKTVAALQSRGCNAIGLCGSDAAVIISKKRPVVKIDYGFVGDVEQINNEIITHFIEAGLVPVFAPLTMSVDGLILNTNADTIASELAIALSENYHVSLYYCFEKQGVLLNPDDDKSLISEIDYKLYNILKDSKKITDGMIPKLENCFNSLRKGVGEIYITNAAMVNQSAGTRIHL